MSETLEPGLRVGSVEQPAGRHDCRSYPERSHDVSMPGLDRSFRSLAEAGGQGVQPAMTPMLDPEIAAAFAAAAQAGVQPAIPPVGDVLALREATDKALRSMLERLPASPDVVKTTFSAVGRDGAVVPLRWFTKAHSQSGSAVIYLHGGGMVCGSSAIYDPLVCRYVQATGVSFLSVDYRLAPEHGNVGLAFDAFAALEWLLREAGNLNIDPSRIAVMGDSGGGGIAAAAAILARDRNIGIARQILVYPMLDDRNVTPDARLEATAVWSYDNNRTAWAAVLGNSIGLADATPYQAPARVLDYSNLPSTYIEVGELDIFRDESFLFAQSLVAAGVPCEFHLHPGAPHAYDLISPNFATSRRAMADRLRVIASL